MRIIDVDIIGSPRQYKWWLIRQLPCVCAAASLVLAPFVVTGYIQGLVAKVLIFGILAMSLDLLIGYTGLLSLGHAVYFGVGGYVVGVLQSHFGINSFWISVPLVVIISAVSAAAIGLMALRLSGIYFLLITFAFGELAYSVAWKWEWLKSPGAQGLAGILKPDLAIPWLTWSATSFYYFVVVIFVICFWLLRRIIASPFGLAIQGIRESEPRMRALGYHTWLYQYLAFIIAGTFAGVAGMLYAYHNGIIIPTHMSIYTTGSLWLMVVIGGAGTLVGPVLGSAVVIFTEFFASLYFLQRWPLILGALFVISVMFLRGGIYRHLCRLWKKVERHGWA